MGKTKLLGLALIATMASFTACTNDAEEVLAQESEIKLTSEITPSRVASLDYQSTQIVEGQQVGVTITGAKNEHKNVAWTVGADGSLTNTGSPIYWGNTQATITAYHPYNSAWTGTSHAFSVSTDQSTEANYSNSDLLWATKTGTKSDETVALTFTHKLAKINVSLTSEDITDLSGATISICGTNIATNFNPSTGELSAATAYVQEIKAGITTANAKTASAIIIPQTIENGTKLIKVQHSNKSFFYSLKDSKAFDAGKSYNYSLKVKEGLVELTLLSNNITDWVNEEVIESEIVEISTPTIENITANSATLTAAAVGGTKGIEISTSSQFSNCIVAGETTSSNITAEFTSLEENTKYYARTYTINAANEKSYSESIMFVPTSVYPKPLILVSNEGETAEVVENGISVTSKGHFIIFCGHECTHESHNQDYIITNGEKIEKNEIHMIASFYHYHNYVCWYAINEYGTTYSSVYRGGGVCDCPPDVDTENEAFN